MEKIKGIKGKKHIIFYMKHNYNNYLYDPSGSHGPAKYEIILTLQGCRCIHKKNPYWSSPPPHQHTGKPVFACCALYPLVVF